MVTDSRHQRHSRISLQSVGSGAPRDFQRSSAKATVYSVKKDAEPGWPVFRYSSCQSCIWTDLKADGQLGDSPLVSTWLWRVPSGSPDDVLQRAAIDYAISHGVVPVAAAGNDADAGMVFPDGTRQ